MYKNYSGEKLSEGGCEREYILDEKDTKADDDNQRDYIHDDH